MGIIGWIVLGLIAGIAKAIMPGNDPGGAVVTILIGIVGALVGALVGGFLAGAILGRDVNEEFFDLATWVSAIVGSLVLLAIYRTVAGRPSRLSLTPATR